MAVRVNKYLSEAGFCSRREADKMVEQGRVSINGVIAVTGSQVDEGDVVEVDGERLSNRKRRIYIAFNKPVGVTCTTDPGDPTNIVSYINHTERIFNIGRLDKPSEGLIFLTNDGNIVNKILRAGNNHEKEYIVSVDRPITAEFAQRMASGVRIMGTMTAKCKFTKETENRFRIVLTQGLNRQIRRMCEALGYKVVTLKRIRVMNITLSGLAKGAWRYFTDAEIEELNRLVALSVGTEEASIKGKKAPYKPSSKKPFVRADERSDQREAAPGQRQRSGQGQEQGRARKSDGKPKSNHNQKPASKPRNSKKSRR